MGTTVRQLLKVRDPHAAPPVTLRQNAVSVATAPPRAGAGFTVEDLVMAINAGQRLQARIKHDGRFQVVGGAVTVELVAARETGGGPRQFACAELVVRTMAVYEARPSHVLLGVVAAMPPEGIVWDITVDGSEVIRVGRQVSLVKTIQKLRTALAPRRVII